MKLFVVELKKGAQYHSEPCPVFLMRIKQDLWWSLTSQITSLLGRGEMDKAFTMIRVGCERDRERERGGGGEERGEGSEREGEKVRQRES